MKKGFTLIELLLSIGFLVFTITASLRLFANCILLNEHNRELTLATSHAQYVVEEIKNTDFEDIENSIDAGNWDLDEAGVDLLGLSSLNTESIDTNEVGSDSELLNVVVTINWQSRSGRNKSVFLETLIAEP